MSSHQRSLVFLVIFPALAAVAFGKENEETAEPWEKEVEAMEREAEELERELEAFFEGGGPAWIPLLSLQGGLGYNDNALRSGVSSEAGAFLLTGFDFMLQKTPGGDGPRFNLFLFGENEHFFTNREIDDQRLASLHAELIADLAPDWELVLPADVSYYDEFTDVSTRETDLDAVRLRGLDLRFEPGIRHHFSEAHKMEGRLVSRQLSIDEPLADYREFGLGVSWEFPPGPDTTLVAEAESVHRRYRTRSALDSDGTVIENRRREFLNHHLATTLKHFWDSDQTWESRLSAGVEINRGNGGGYYDYYRPILSHRLVYHRNPWRMVARTGASHYHYDVRTTEGGASETYASGELRGEFAINTHLRLFADYSHDNIMTNEPGAAYRVNRTLVGAEWTF